MFLADISSHGIRSSAVTPPCPQVRRTGLLEFRSADLTEAELSFLALSAESIVVNPAPAAEVNVCTIHKLSG